MPERHPRSRSGSPHRHESRRHRHRSRSPRRHQNSTVPRKALPLGAREISRHDLSSFRPLFALYLDIQKQIDIEELDDNEVKGRWKSFVGKWNRGELAEGWYDAKTLERARAAEQEAPKSERTLSKPLPDYDDADNADDADDADFGPALPTSLLRAGRVDRSAATAKSHGASIPSLQDLRARDEQAEEDAAIAREKDREDLRDERRADRKLQKERMDEIAPRAEAGTRERQLEKRREKADSNRAFAASKDASGDVEVRDADVMGDEDSLGDLKRMQNENERRKNEREIRKEEVLRARREEREARLAGMKEKEDRTMAMFKEIARARFGGGDGES